MPNTPGISYANALKPPPTSASALLPTATCPGPQRPRLTGAEYDEVVDEFVEAMKFHFPQVLKKHRALLRPPYSATAHAVTPPLPTHPPLCGWGQALIQFEDFSSDHAGPILAKYREHTLCFNDDIQVQASI